MTTSGGVAIRSASSCGSRGVSRLQPRHELVAEDAGERSHVGQRAVPDSVTVTVPDSVTVTVPESESETVTESVTVTVPESRRW